MMKTMEEMMLNNTFKFRINLINYPLYHEDSLDERLGIFIYIQ
jgi:hypothetical protein